LNCFDFKISSILDFHPVSLTVTGVLLVVVLALDEASSPEVGLVSCVGSVSELLVVT
jgi:hypothetical protein